ncbi:RES family NAD+ phosphorylase [Oscillatoria amoena NRMC-F 0135]|nr:RES family NAD+ phosphorylase [Oscillatoria amoena NRMC-F 0135]
MRAYRIARTEFCDVSGEGAKRYGGRWNLPGQPALYACSSVSAGLLERLTIDPELFSAERYQVYSIMEFQIPDKLIYQPGLSELPDRWDSVPAGLASQQFGASIFQKGMMCFGVPSVVDRSSVNYVINPLAPEFSQLKWQVYPLRLDQRIVR